MLVPPLPDWLPAVLDAVTMIVWPACVITDGDSLDDEPPFDVGVALEVALAEPSTRTLLLMPVRYTVKALFPPQYC